MSAAQDGSPRTRTSLDRVAQAYSTVRGYHVVAAETNHVTGGVVSQNAEMPGPEQQTLAVDYAPPDRWRIQGSANPLVRIVRGNREFGFPKGGGMPTSGGNIYRGVAFPIRLIDYSAVMKDLSSATTLREEAALVDGVRIPCTVIEATYPLNRISWGAAGFTLQGLPSHQFHLTKRALWVDNTRYVVLREVDSIEGDWWSKDSPNQQQTLFEHTFTVQEVEWNQPPADSLFEIGLPPGTVSPDGARVTPMLDGTPPLAPILDACQNLDDPWKKRSCLQKAQTEPCVHVPITKEVAAAQLGGCETIALTVNPDGHAVDIRVKAGLGLGLDEEVAACVAEWRFRPPQKDGSNPHEEVGIWGIGVTNTDSFWRLLRVQFPAHNGANRPVFLKTSYPGKFESERVIGFSLFLVHLTVGKDGRPRDVEVIPPVDSKLDKIAIKTVSSWRFRPGQEGGKPAETPAIFALGFGENGHCDFPK